MQDKDVVDLYLHLYQKEFKLSYLEVLKEPYEKILFNLALLGYYNKKEEIESKKMQSKKS